MKKLDTHTRFTLRKELTAKKEIIFKIIQASNWKRLLCLTIVMSLAVLFMSNSTDYQPDKTCQDTHISLDTDCADAAAMQLYPQEAESPTNQTPNANHTVRMGFSFLGIWDFLVAKFSTWTADDDDDETSISEEDQKQLLLAPDCPPANVATPYIGGQIFRDVDHNGMFDNTIDVPIPNILVSVYSDTGLVGTTTSSADGDYLFQNASMTVGTEYRVEFTGYPSYLQTATAAAGTYTSVQFVTPNVCNIDFGLVDPYEYVDANPSLVVTCFVEGDNVGRTEDVLVSLDFDNPTTISKEAQALATGTTYGVAYYRFNLCSHRS